MSNEDGVVALADAVSELFYAIAGWLLIGLGALGLIAAVVGLAAGGGVGSTMGVALLVLFAFVLVASGVLVNPRLRRRLDRRHPITRFGRVRSTDRRIVRSGEARGEACVDCGSPVESGIATRYREEYALAGVPISTRTEGVNHYCLACALDESGIPETRARERLESAPERS